MMLPHGNVRVWLCTAATDMRKSYNGLSAMVKRELGDNPLSYTNAHPPAYAQTHQASNHTPVPLSSLAVHTTLY